MSQELDTSLKMGTAQTLTGTYKPLITFSINGQEFTFVTQGSCPTEAAAKLLLNILIATIRSISHEDGHESNEYLDAMVEKEIKIKGKKKAAKKKAKKK